MIRISSWTFGNVRENSDFTRNLVRHALARARTTGSNAHNSHSHILTHTTRAYNNADTPSASRATCDACDARILHVHFARVSVCFLHQVSTIASDNYARINSVANKLKRPTLDRPNQKC